MTVLLAVAFVVLAGLVAGGVVDPLDQWALDHVMPGSEPGSEANLTVVSVLQPYRSGDGALANAAHFWLYPASVPISAAVVGLCCWALVRRERRREAVLWAAAWVMGSVIEGVGKTLIERPTLTGTAHGVRVPAGGFDQSFPSGHTIRGIVLVAALVYVWRRTLPFALAWLVPALVLLVVTGDHVPTDVLGGILVALMLVYPLHARLRTEARRE